MLLVQAHPWTPKLSGRRLSWRSVTVPHIELRFSTHRIALRVLYLDLCEQDEIQQALLKRTATPIKVRGRSDTERAIQRWMPPRVSRSQVVLFTYKTKARVKSSLLGIEARDRFVRLFDIFQTANLLNVRQPSLPFANTSQSLSSFSELIAAGTRVLEEANGNSCKNGEVGDRAAYTVSSKHWVM